MGDLASEDMGTSGSSEASSVVSVMTWNVWFDALGQYDRHEAVLAEVKKLKPDVACFQEVTAVFMELLKEEKNILREYAVSPNHIRAYGCLTLVKKTFKNVKFLEVPFKNSGMDRSLILATVGSFAVGNVHLESLCFERKRKEQLQTCEKELRGYKNALLVGDFNFDATKTYGDWRRKAPKVDPAFLENAVLAKVLPSWIDAWPVIKGLDDPGFTFDGATNPKCVRDRQEQMRYDRIMVKGDCQNALSSISMLGQSTINDWGLKPSDHYGLYLKMNPEGKPSAPTS